MTKEQANVDSMTLVKVTPCWLNSRTISGSSSRTAFKTCSWFDCHSASIVQSTRCWSQTPRGPFPPPPDLILVRLSLPSPMSPPGKAKRCGYRIGSPVTMFRLQEPFCQ